MGIFIGMIIFMGIAAIISWGIASRMFKQMICKPGQSGGFLFYREAVQERYLLSDFNAWEKEVFYLESAHGYYLHGTHIHAKEPSRKFIVLCHGFSCQQLTSYKYVQLFLDEGFHVIVYDHRFHGLSGGDFITYGYYEKDDLAAVIQWIKQKFCTDTTVGVHGESMGASIALLYAAQRDQAQADFYIADCPFDNFQTILKERYKHTYPKLPRFPFFPLSHRIWKRKLRFDWTEISPVFFMKNIHKPVLLIHTQGDRFTDPAHSRRLHEANPKETELILMPEGGHAQAVVKNREAYKETVQQFLKKHQTSA